jgi:site-specific recombinase XerD
VKQNEKDAASAEIINSKMVYQYLVHCQNIGQSERIRSEKKFILRALARIAIEMNGTPLLDVDKSFIRGYIADRFAYGLAPNSVNKITSTIRAFYRFLSEQQYISADPSVGLKLAKVFKRRPSILEKKEIEAVLRELDSFYTKFSIRDITMAKFFYYTGVTTTELAELRVRKIDFEKSTIKIESGDPRKWRTVPLPKPLRKQIAKYFAELKSQRKRLLENDYLFPGRYGQKMNRSHIYERMSFILVHTSSAQNGAETLRNSHADHF